MKVALLAPNIGVPGNFYDFFGDLVQVAARQLDVDLEIVDGTKQREVMLERGRKLLVSPDKPDYLMFANYMSVAKELLPESASAGVRTFLVVESLASTESGTRLSAGGSCLGEIVPDDLEAGKSLAEILATEARRRGLLDSDANVQVAALAGEHTPAGNARFRGWMAFKREQPHVVQAGFQYGGWEEGPAKIAASMMLRAAPKIGVIWCANDAMAMGALRAAREAGRVPGKDILIGGVDLVDRALAEVASGALEVSIGGHVVDGVRALMLLYDHHETQDLAPTRETTHLVAVRKDQADRYRDFMQKRAWRDVDFTRFSRRKNPGAASLPPLSLESIMQDA